MNTFSAARVKHTSGDDNPLRNALRSFVLDLSSVAGALAGFRSGSQGQVNSAVAAKEHSRVHLCLRLALRKPLYQPNRLSASFRTGEDGKPQSIP
ncbi:unnamed protein product [Nezara viridula]|uniref:Uncharacterized protein n=1 Tax=Nezara viridula TaxID=85310 RepID=A0A9P0H7K2_NEZVI|nr:unnamed protein product [Nezara viridula]